MVSLGFFGNLRELLSSPPDESSELDGRALVTRAVDRMVVMGGYYPEGYEFNIAQDPRAAAEVIAGWPTPVDFLGWETGFEAFTGREISRDDPRNLVGAAYRSYSGEGAGRESWDLIAMHYAITDDHAFYRPSTRAASSSTKTEPHASCRMRTGHTATSRWPKSPPSSRAHWMRFSNAPHAPALSDQPRPFQEDTHMPFTLGVVGAGQFAGQFAKLFTLHPDVGSVYVTDLLADRSSALVERLGLAGTFESFDTMIASPEVDAVAIFTQRWTHGPLVVRALEAGKHVYSAVPMAISTEEIADIIDAVRRTGLTYMMGETSYYNPATVLARTKLDENAFGRVFYAEGDYVHDMDLGFYDAYRYSGGEGWKATASYPPLLYPTHAIGGVLGALPTHAVSVSAIGVRDDRGDGVFDRAVSMFGNDFSNASALFELADGGVMRTNEMRRVGYPSHIKESRFRFFGTEGSLEQLATVTLWQDKHGVTDITDLIRARESLPLDDPSLADVSPALRDAFVSGHAAIHDLTRLPAEFLGAPNGHEGSHHYLVDDFVRAVSSAQLPPINAWTAARFTLPGIIGHESAMKEGERLRIPDFGDAPTPPARW